MQRRTRAAPGSRNVMALVFPTNEARNNNTGGAVLGAIVGGLVFSQLLTLYTTPVVYLYLDRFRLWAGRRWPWSARRTALGGQAT